MKNKTVGQIVAENIDNAKIFKKYKIDFCCGGDVTLEEACEKNNISVEEVVAELENLQKNSSENETKDFANMELDELADYIVKTHHKYVREQIPVVEEYVTKIARVHGENHNELLGVQEYFFAVRDELLAHMPKEENVLFPYISRLVNAKKTGEKIGRPPFMTIRNPIRMMEAEHDSAGDAYVEIHKLTNDYELPADACNSYRIAFNLLEEFENDLNIHIHLENNILFPKAIALEDELLA